LNDSTNTAIGRGCQLALLAGLVVLVIVAATYWPVLHAGFVWDDVIDFQGKAWLTQGDAWKHYIWKDFNYWTNYFRPLVVGLFTIELRVFGVEPGPMHAVSLLIHLINTALVGVLAWRLATSAWTRARWIAAAVPMLIYGIHPVLIEPVAWIGCQFDLIATLFMLLGLALNLAIKRAWWRALGVALCFFLAACSKESAAVLPLILVVFDWVVLDTQSDSRLGSQVKGLLQKNGLTYAALVVAGIAYLVLRDWALGSLTLHAASETSPAYARLQEVSYLYLHYWRTLFWPMLDMSPEHPVSPERFLAIDALSIVSVLLALAIVLAGVLLAMRRFVAGSVMLVVTCSLLPVLHIVAAGLDSSLYHERYAMTALATACALMPPAIAQILSLRISRPVLWVIGMALTSWCSLSILNIRATLPLWSTDVQLWQWVVRDHPDDVVAKAQLIAAYVDAHDGTHAFQLADQVAADNVPCTYCMLNAARLALRERNTQRAAFYLDQIKGAPDLFAVKLTYETYLTQRADLLRLQGHWPDAENAARSAISLDQLDPAPQWVLTLVLIGEGRYAEAQAVFDAALPLFPAPSRAWQRRTFERTVENAKAARQASEPSAK
jgi:hypothetical protein